LGYTQWVNQGITLNPPPPSESTPSIVNGNFTTVGYPELSYFLKNYFKDNISNDP